MSTLGKPNLQMMFFHMKLHTAASVIYAKASASTYLVKYSTATTSNFRCPGAGGNGPTMSIPHCSNGQVGAIGVNFDGGIREAVELTWQAGHLLMKSTESCNKVGQKYPVLLIFWAKILPEV